MPSSKVKKIKVMAQTINQFQTILFNNYGVFSDISHIQKVKIVFFTVFSAVSAAMRRIGSVSVRPTVYGWTGGGQVFASTSPRQEAENGNDDNENDDQTRDGNADGEIPLRKADHTRIIGSHFCGRFLIDESVIVEVAGLTNV